jgi:phosphatidate cytidylyltransferase
MKRNVQFNRQRRMSRSSIPDMDGATSPTEEKKDRSKSPNGDIKRPDYDRADTTHSGWATENEDEKV